MSQPPPDSAYPNDLRQELKETMHDLIGTRIRVAIVPDGVTRNTFEPQIAVAGPLEMRTGPDGEPRYRVICDDDNFTYFTLDNIVLANPLARVPTITLNIPVIPEQTHAD